MKRILALVFMLVGMATLANATAPSPKFLFVGSATTCGGGDQVTDYIIDPLSGRHWIMFNAIVCYSDNHGATWTQFTAGGPYTCFPTTAGIHLKKFQLAPDGTLVMFTGVNSSCTSGAAAWWLDNVADIPTHRGTTFTKSVTAIRSSSTAPWMTSGALSSVTTQDGHWIITMTNHNSPTQGMGIWTSNDNGRTYVLATVPATGSNGETFGAFADPGSNVRYVGFGALASACATWTNFAYTTNNDGSTWQMIPYVTGGNPPCGDTWTPIIVPPNQGSYAGKALFITGPGIQTPTFDTEAWVMGPLGSPTSLTFTDVTGNLYSGNTSSNKSAKSYGNLITGIDWNYRMFIMSVNWTLANNPSYAPVWSDTLPTWGQTDTVSGNNLPSFYSSSSPPTPPCTSTGARPNFCLSMGIDIDRNATSSTYGQVCIPMRTGDLYCTQLPQSHKASSFNFPLGAISVNVGADYPSPETIAVSYLDTDTADPTCPAITGNGTVYPSRSAGVFSSSDPTIATVNATTGVVHGVANGVAYPLFTCGGVTSANGPQIAVGGVTLSSVTITPSTTQNVIQNATVAFTSDCLYSDGSHTDCGFNPPGWTSTDISCVTVAGTGTGQGLATATSTLHQSCTASIKLTVASVDSNAVTFNVNSFAPAELHGQIKLQGQIKVIP